MKAKLLLGLFALWAVAVNAALEPEPVPGCPIYSLTDVSLGATPGFLPNLLFYNAGNLMAGQPHGPWFGLEEGANCFYIPNSTLSCPITLYQNEARTQVIGSGTISGTNTLFLQNGYIGGDLVLSYTITPGSVTINPSPDTNFQSRTATLHFKPERTYPTDVNQPAVANRAIFSSDLQSGVLTLWGSNGWNGSQFVNYNLGIDFRARLVCVEEPPVENPCIPAPGSAFSVAYACAQSGQSVRFRSSSTSIGLSFNSGPAQNCNNF